MSNVEQFFSLQGRFALVTGARTGLGRRFAATLADAGATVICAARATSCIEQVAADIKQAGGKAFALDVDIGSTDSVERLSDRAEKAAGGRVNVLVNSVVRIDFGPFPGVTGESWNNLLNVNFTGSMRSCRSFSRRLIENGASGAIVNITSVTGEPVMGAVPTYGSIKAGLNHLTRSIARLPLKGVGDVKELDRALLLLTSKAGSYTNGHVRSIDAGQVIWRPGFRSRLAGIKRG